MSLGNQQVAVECDNCGKNSGTVEAGGARRCVDCGQFSEKADQYCVEHDFDYEVRGCCPICRERQRVEAERQHMMTRDRRVEPY